MDEGKIVQGLEYVGEIAQDPPYRLTHARVQMHRIDDLNRSARRVCERAADALHVPAEALPLVAGGQKEHLATIEKSELAVKLPAQPGALLYDLRPSAAGRR